MAYTVRNDVGVSMQTALGVSVCGVITGQVPDDESLITTA